MWDVFVWGLWGLWNLCLKVLRGTFLLVLIQAVNIDLIFQTQKYSFCRVESFPLEMLITLQDTTGKNGWQMYLLLILPMYSTIQGGEMCWRKSHKYLYFNPISFQKCSQLY